VLWQLNATITTKPIGEVECCDEGGYCKSRNSNEQCYKARQGRDLNNSGETARVAAGVPGAVPSVDQIGAPGASNRR
jgi:hypothetical protein